MGLNDERDKNRGRGQRPDPTGQSGAFNPISGLSKSLDIKHRPGQSPAVVDRAKMFDTASSINTKAYTGAPTESKEIIQAMIALIDRTFDAFQNLTWRANERSDCNDLGLSVTRPELSKEKTHDWHEAESFVSVFTGRLNTRLWSLIVRGTVNDVNAYIVPSDRLFAFNSNPQDFKPYLQIIPVEAKREVRWLIETQEIPEDLMPKLQQMLFDALVRFHRNQAQVNETFKTSALTGQTSSGKSPAEDEWEKQKRYREQFFADMQAGREAEEQKAAAPEPEIPSAQSENPGAQAGVQAPPSNYPGAAAGLAPPANFPGHAAGLAPPAPPQAQPVAPLPVAPQPDPQQQQLLQQQQLAQQQYQQQQLQQQQLQQQQLLQQQALQQQLQQQQLAQQLQQQQMQQQMALQQQLQQQQQQQIQQVQQVQPPVPQALDAQQLQLQQALQLQQSLLAQSMPPVQHVQAQPFPLPGQQPPAEPITQPVPPPAGLPPKPLPPGQHVGFRGHIKNLLTEIDKEMDVIAKARAQATQDGDKEAARLTLRLSSQLFTFRQTIQKFLDDYQG